MQNETKPIASSSMLQVIEYTLKVAEFNRWSFSSQLSYIFLHQFPYRRMDLLMVVKEPKTLHYNVPCWKKE